MAKVLWGQQLAEVYDAVTPGPPEAMLDVLHELAGDGPALELAVGTGRVALPLRARGVEVHGIELSPDMVEQLRAKPGGADLPVALGDMTNTRVDGTFTLVYLVANTIMNVTTQEEQVAVVANAAAHLRPGGRFVVELVVPQLRRVPLGEPGWIFTLDPDHVGIETFDDEVGQIAWSRHWMDVDGRLVRHDAPYRYVWPSELDLMARLAGLERADRWAGWDRSPFEAESRSHVTVYERPAG